MKNKKYTTQVQTHTQGLSADFIGTQSELWLMLKCKQCPVISLVTC